MFENFSVRHIPSLFIAAATTFGGLVAFFDAEYAIEGFGLPRRIACSKEAQAVMILSSTRTTAIGATIFAFYFQDKFAEVDVIMAILGAYVGAVDGHVCWREGMPGKAIFHATLGLVIAAVGWLGLTEGVVEKIEHRAGSTLEKAW